MVVGFDEIAKLLRVTVINNFQLLPKHEGLRVKGVGLKCHYPKNG